MLEDLVVAATNQAMEKAREAAAAEERSQVSDTGGPLARQLAALQGDIETLQAQLTGLTLHGYEDGAGARQKARQRPP